MRRQELALAGHVVGVHAAADAHGPEELVHVVARVAREAAEDDEHVVHVERAQDGQRLVLRRGEHAPDRRDVRVVPRVVVHEHRAVRHGRHLVAVVPPARDLRVGVRVVAQPVVGLAVVVVEHARAVRHAPRLDDDGRAAVGHAAHVRRVEAVEAQQAGAAQQHEQLQRLVEQVLEGRVLRLGLAAAAAAGGRRLVLEDELRREALEQLGDADGREDARDGREREHEAHHDAGEVPGHRAVQDDKDAAVADVVEEEVEPHRRERHKHVQVEEEGRPRRRLVLRHGRDDGDVLRRVGRVQQRQRPPRPLHLAGELQRDEEGAEGAHEPRRAHDEDAAQHARVHDAVEVRHDRVDLQADEDAVRGRALRLLHHVEAHEGHHHGADAADDIEDAVGHVEALGEAPGHDEHDRVDGDHVDDEDVAAPGRHHVEVRERRRGRVEHGAGVHRLDPQVEHEEQREDGHALVIVGPAHRAADVARHDGDERRGQERRRRAPRHLLGEEERRERRVRREERRQEDAHVADVHRDVEEVEQPVQHRRRVHETRVDRAADGAAQRVPAAVVEPVQEVHETLRGEVLGRAEVEVRVELVDYGLVAHDGEEADEEGERADHAERHRRVDLGPFMELLHRRLGQAVPELLLQRDDAAGAAVSGARLGPRHGRRVRRGRGRLGRALLRLVGHGSGWARLLLSHHRRRRGPPLALQAP
mmetsp:Transcript_30451/g.97155  ORF Transcript_30451/g.97155 Transcript_30451/m.97155 type:complete len:702 (-) Transcript_30451:109-2214(-)